MHAQFQHGPAASWDLSNGNRLLLALVFSVLAASAQLPCAANENPYFDPGSQGTWLPIGVTEHS